MRPANLADQPEDNDSNPVRRAGAMDDPKLRERIEAAIDMAWHTEYVYGAQGEEPERTLDI
jgi:hypothetical protein